MLLATVWLVGRIVNSRFGMVIRGAKSNETRMLALGFPVLRYRLTAFVIAGAICGLAGALMANQAAFVSPAMMNWVQSGDLIVMVVIGGIQSLLGPVYGAVAFIVVEHLLSSWLKDTWQLVFGPLIVLLAIFARNGLDDLFALLSKPGATPMSEAGMTEPLLATERLVKRFGGLVATDELSLDVRAGEIHALIGPNGAGKSTAIAQLAGQLTPTAGRILFEGRDITRLNMPMRARLGIARSFQITSVLKNFTTLDNVALAVQAHQGHSFRFWRNARRDPALREPAMRVHRRARPGRARRCRGRRVVARRAAPARDRDGAGR